ncbi:MAG: hypothetical protein ACRCZZ_05850 [Phocaeicola sp.]
MNIQTLLNHETDVITERAIKIPFDFSNRESIPKRESPDCVVVTPITVRTWFKLRPLLLQIDREDLESIVVQQGETSIDAIDMMDKYGDLLLDIVCIGIHNKPSDPPEWFKEALKDNSTWGDIRILLNAILYRIGQFPFYKSITTLQSVSPTGETEIIAAQKNLQSWRGSAKSDS